MALPKAAAKKKLSFEDLKKKDVNGKTFQDVEYCGGIQEIGSLGSDRMIVWLEENDDKVKQREAGLRLIVESIVNEDHEHLPENRREEFLEVFRVKDARENGKLVKACLTLNGLGNARGAALIKNESSEASTGASPSASPSPATATT